jgi:hypothetical protein
MLLNLSKQMSVNVVEDALFFLLGGPPPPPPKKKKNFVADKKIPLKFLPIMKGCIVQSKKECPVNI